MLSLIKKLAKLWTGSLVRLCYAVLTALVLSADSGMRKQKCTANTKGLHNLGHIFSIAIPCPCTSLMRLICRISPACTITLWRLRRHGLITKLQRILSVRWCDLHMFALRVHARAFRPQRKNSIIASHFRSVRAHYFDNCKTHTHIASTAIATRARRWLQIECTCARRVRCNCRPSPKNNDTVPRMTNERLRVCVSCGYFLPVRSCARNRR